MEIPEKNDIGQPLEPASGSSGFMLIIAFLPDFRSLNPQKAVYDGKIKESVMQEKGSPSSIRINHPTRDIQPVSYAKAVRWLANYLENNDALLSVFFHANKRSCQPLLHFLAWAIQHHALMPSVGAPTTGGMVTMLEVLQERAPGGAKKTALDWLRFHVQQDHELRAILINLYDPTDPPFYHFVAWTLKRHLLKPLTKAEHDNLNPVHGSEVKKTEPSKKQEQAKKKGEKP